MDTLPEELQLRILEYLDFTPPSEEKARQEPSLTLTLSTSCPLKNVSSLSKHWRRITLPLIIKHACLRVDRTVQPHWLDCCLHNDTTLKYGESTDPPARVDQHHHDLLRASPSTAADMDATPSLWLRKIRSSNNASEHEYASKVWASRIYHASKDFIDFVVAKSLQKRIESFVLLSDGMQAVKIGQIPSPIAHEWRYEAAAAMWQHVLSVIDPVRVAIVAPPMELACFCNCFISLDADPDPELAWAFTDMDYHIVELQQPRADPQSQLTQLLPYGQLQPIPDCSAQRNIAPSSIFNLRQWTSLSLNEGSFLKAYGTYEYFERGPPSLISSISSSVIPPNYPDTDRSGPRALSSIRSFTYTAIFPFANHIDFFSMIPQLETLDFQFAPDPQSGILDDRERTGRAELSDCWQELISGYHDVSNELKTSTMSKEMFPVLKTFICRDVGIPALKMDLDQLFTPLCLPVWAEYEDGVFHRIADKAEIPGLDDTI